MTCKAFAWIGQSMEHCDNCGLDISVHEGLAWHESDGKPFGLANDIILTFDEAWVRIPLFAHYVTRIGPPEGPYRYSSVR